jgi:hypothetical protein
VVLGAAAFAASLATPASANVYCEGVGPVRGFGPVCTVRCAATLRPAVDPSRVPPVTGLSAPCMWED